MKYALFAACLFMCACGTSPSDITSMRGNSSSLVVQCQDEHEPVLLITENRTVGVVTCAKRGVAK